MSKPQFSARVDVDTSSLGHAIVFVRGLKDEAERAMQESFAETAADATLHAKTGPKAKWHDRTGRARSTLFVRPTGGKSTGFVVGGLAPYQKFLELRRDFHGKYSTIRDTTNWELQKVLGTVFPKKLHRIKDRSEPRRKP